jgi:hypothetical protein
MMPTPSNDTGMRPNNAFENGRSQARLRALARAVQRGR